MLLILLWDLADIVIVFVIVIYHYYNDRMIDHSVDFWNIAYNVLNPVYKMLSMSVS